MRRAFAALIVTLIICSSASLVFAQLIPLTFRPIAAEYSSSLDRIIMISANPDQLHIYNSAAFTDTAVSLSKSPLSLSVSPDGLYAAVGHDSLVTYVNLSGAVIEKTFPTSVASPNIVLGAYWIHVLVKVHTYSSDTVSLNIETGEALAPSGYIGYDFTYPRLNPAVGAIYGTRDGTSPNDIEKIDVSTGPMTSGTDSIYHGDYRVCGPVFFSPDGNRIYTGCGTVFQASTDQSVDMHYTGSLAGVSRVTNLAESSALKTIALIPLYFDASYNLYGDNSVALYESDFLNQVGIFKLPDFQAGPNSYAAHGKWVFFNAASTALLVLEQADETSGMLNDFRLQIIPLTPPSSCGAAFGTASAQVVASGAIGSVDITASGECRYAAVSQAPWIEIVSGGYGSGDGVLTYIVRANDGPAREGTISLGESLITISQDAGGAATPLTRLPYNVVDAAYDKPLDELVLVSAGPNELHIYNPRTHADQNVPLALPPFSVSVRPDGLYAAVGHDGWVSYVNLQTASVEHMFKVLTDVGHILLAGNGYAYLFPERDWSDIYSLNIAAVTTTATSAIYDGRVPRLYADGNFMYVGGNWFSKWAIGQGVATPVNSNLYGGTCGNLWLTEDGRRMFTACGSVYFTSTVPSQDLQPNGSLSGLSTVVWTDEASIPGLTAVIGKTDYYSPGAEKLRIYGDAFLQLMQTLPFPEFSVGDAYYPGYGQFAFWNAAESNVIVVEKVDEAAGLLSGYGISVMTPLRGLPGSDFDGDGKSDISVWRPETGVWYTLPSSDSSSFTANRWGASEDLAVPGDYDGDGKSDIAVFRPSVGIWYVLMSSTPGSYSSVQWGLSTDEPFPADYDGDGKTDIAVWRQNTGTWYILPSSIPGSYISVQGGDSADIAVPGDYDGDRMTDIAVWNPSTGTWKIMMNGIPGAYTSVRWGLPDDIVVPADYDGDWKTDIAVWRPSTGIWYVLTSGTPGSYTSVQWGLPGDVPVAADYDGDGKADIAMWRPGTGAWYVLPSGSPGTYTSRQWGLPTDVPITSLTPVFGAIR